MSNNIADANQMPNMGAPCSCENTTKPITKSQPRAGNENVINISLPSHEGWVQRQPQATQQIQIDPQPIKLFIDSTTDWPTVLVGAGSILTAGIVGWLTHVNQKRQAAAQENQTKATAATFRAEWQVSLRSAIAKFLSQVALIKFELDADPGYLSKSDSNAPYSELIESQVLIGLLLDPSKRRTDRVKDLASEIISDLKSKNTTQINLKVNELADISADILEKAWQDIQKDLYK